MLRTAAAVMLVLLPALALRAEVYQYAVPGQTAAGKEMTTYLWVPPNADRVRGLILGGLATSMESVFCDDPLIRQVCAEQKLAIVYFTPHLGPLLGRDGQDAVTPVQQVIDQLAQASHHPEMKVAPWFPIGHSVSTVYASLLTASAGPRCFGAFLHKGGIVLGPDDSRRGLRDVPILAIKGQFEEFGPGPNGVLRDHEDRSAAWKTMRDTLLRLRAEDPRYLVSLLVEPGATHFAWSDFSAPFVARFLREAARQRIPDWPVDAREPVMCTVLDPRQTGALSAGDPEQRPPVPADVPGKFQGAPAESMWHLSLELAQAADAMHKGMHGKPQFIAFTDPVTGKVFVPRHDLQLRFTPHWTGPDVFTVAGTFLTEPPRKYPPADGPIGHAEGALQFVVYGGQIEALSPTTFRVKANPRRKPEANLTARHLGDATYRYAEQCAILPFKPLTAGTAQQITFPPVAPIVYAGEKTPRVKLAAVSDSGLPVRYYVDHGPARIEGDELVIADVPARAVFPMTITVTAYQSGSAVEPRVQTAATVAQTIQLVK